MLRSLPVRGLIKPIYLRGSHQTPSWAGTQDQAPAPIHGPVLSTHKTIAACAGRRLLRPFPSERAVALAPSLANSHWVVGRTLHQVSQDLDLTFTPCDFVLVPALLDLNLSSEKHAPSTS